MLKTIRYIAIDDNPVDLLILKEYAGEHPHLLHCGSFSNITDGIQQVAALKPDLVFLDIEMPGLSGIELLKTVKDHISIAVFVTSHPEFALEGFELSALDYILKPVTADRFSYTAKRIADYWDMKQKSAAYEVLFEKESLTIKDGHTQVKLPQEDIIYLEAMQDYTKVVTEKKNYLTLTTLTGFLEKFSNNNFLRVHRSYAVAVKKIKELHHNKIVCGDITIPIGKTYRSAVAQIKL
ncbi:MAG: LytTR family DNA-binding domain-containing protein [Bacteroidota bacterium]|nr:LytTR family DNA-binding domain-containing protein [Bacteroidota bacterium]